MHHVAPPSPGAFTRPIRIVDTTPVKRVKRSRVNKLTDLADVCVGIVGN